MRPRARPIALRAELPVAGVDEPDRDLAHLGTAVKWLPGPAGGWGFVAPNKPIKGFVHTREDRLVFVHRANLPRNAQGVLKANERVRFYVMPPQDPSPGMAFSSTACRSASEYSPLACFPTASKTETISRDFSSP